MFSSQSRADLGSGVAFNYHVLLLVKLVLKCLFTGLDVTHGK